jgi:hypothetical protein
MYAISLQMYSKSAQKDQYRAVDVQPTIYRGAAMPLLKLAPKLQQQTSQPTTNSGESVVFLPTLQKRHAILMTKQEQLESKIRGEIWNKVWCHPSRV